MNYVLHSASTVRSGTASTCSMRTTSINRTRATASNEARTPEHMSSEQSRRPARSRQPRSIRSEQLGQMTAGSLKSKTDPHLRIWTSSPATETAHGNSWLPTCRLREPGHAMCHIAIWRRAPPPRPPCCRPRPIGAPGSGPARRRPPPPPRRLRRCRPRRAAVASARLPAPVGGRRSLPRRDTYGRSDSTNGGWGVGHQRVHLVPHSPLAVPRQRQERGGSLRPLPLRWRGSGRPVQDEKPEQRQRKSDGRRGTPPTLFWVHPPSFARTILLDPRLDPRRDPAGVQRPTSASITWLPTVETGDRRTRASRRPFTAAVRPPTGSLRQGTPPSRSSAAAGARTGQTARRLLRPCSERHAPAPPR